MCNSTSRDLMVSGNSQLSNDVSSDSEELNKDGQDEQINNSNNSSVSLSASLSLQQQSQNASSELNNGLIDSFNSARLLQTMNLLLNSSSSLNNNNNNNINSDELNSQPQNQLNNELLEAIQRLLNQNGNQNLTSSLLAAANQRPSLFTCKFCSFSTAKRQQLIKHVRTNCEGLLTAVANLQSTNNNSTNATNNSTNSTNAINSPSSPTTGDQQTNDDTGTQMNSSSTLSATATMAALSNDKINSGCGNLVCINSNCTSNSINGNNCIILPNLPNEKFKSIGPAEDSEDDNFTSSSSANPQDRYCSECEIQFASYNNYKVSALELFI